METFRDLPLFLPNYFKNRALFRIRVGGELVKDIRRRVLPELELRDGVFEAAVLGQGEITFRELVEAVQTKSDLEDVPGLALWRDGEAMSLEVEIGCATVVQ